LENNSKEIYIKSGMLNRWHPYIVFFDKELNILSIYEEDAVKKKVKVQIPENTKYIMIDDKYTLSNLKSGLQVYISSK
jgi:hypothetical protein